MIACLPLEALLVLILRMDTSFLIRHVHLSTQKKSAILPLTSQKLGQKAESQTALSPGIDAPDRGNDIVYLILLMWK